MAKRKQVWEFQFEVDLGWFNGWFERNTPRYRVCVEADGSYAIYKRRWERELVVGKPAYEGGTLANAKAAAMRAVRRLEAKTAKERAAK